MAELRWRDDVTGEETVFPWPIPDGPLRTFDPMVKDTVAGKCVLFTDILPDEGIAICLTYLGGARFARISPEIDWSLEERRVGDTFPVVIFKELADVWRTTLEQFAARNKELREQAAKGVGPRA